MTVSLAAPYLPKLYIICTLPPSPPPLPPAPHLKCLPPSCWIKAVKPLLVTLSVTMVDPGWFASTMAAMSAMNLLV